MKAAFLALFLLPVALVAATFRVNNAPNTSPDYSTIQAAINAATDGDTILIEGSTTPYTGFTLTNKRLNLIGPGYGLPYNPGTPANKLSATITSPTSYIRTSTTSAGSADGSLVIGLEFNYDITLDGCANVTVSRCAFGMQSSQGRINVNGPANVLSQCYLRSSSPINISGSTAAGLRIENCILPEADLFAGGGTYTLHLRNNILRSIPSLSGVSIQADNNIFISTSTPPATNSIYRNNIFPGTPSGLTGSGNLTGVNLSIVMPAYQNSSASFDGRYQLATGVNGPAPNPALNAGTDGTHIGPFGGANPYILSGIPPLPTIDELSVPTFAAPGGNVTIRVKVGARP